MNNRIRNFIVDGVATGEISPNEGAFMIRAIESNEKETHTPRLHNSFICQSCGSLRGDRTCIMCGAI